MRNPRHAGGRVRRGISPKNLHGDEDGTRPLMLKELQVVYIALPINFQAFVSVAESHKSHQDSVT